MVGPAGQPVMIWCRSLLSILNLPADVDSLKVTA
jgi:hypothetical protein